MMLNSKSVGDKIAAARKKNNLSQADLAQQVSISSQAVGKWERGESMPDISTLNRIAEILGVDLNYFSETFKSNVSESQFETNKKESPETTATKPKTNLGLSWNMSSGNWVDADFSGLSNLKDKFSTSNMKNCKLIGSDLSNLTLKSNNILGCDFSNSDLRNSKIQTSNLDNNQFIECLLIDTEFSSSEIKNCNFSKANFSGVELRTSELKKCIIENAVWNLSAFKLSHISDVVFNGTIEECSFENCSFTKVTFKNATIINTFFKGKKLKGIQFIDCQTDRITYEFLKNGKADLTGLTLLA
ncbi:transcriptional regulator with XRE-family HTH domain [Flavobacterium sp. 90]|uniref:helix-turn-helix domain-containing protein n=1 Tax=unclassified Flavobacterium TaxID=196869 RepID=UPI0010EF740A|nr:MULTISPECIES: pentapeptide repeat-containing protein [unclassified Flavobacterium]TCK52575.1 transcriptional regulator with XRE-family HTH domain [Flavobacterium sp. 90]